MNLVNGVQALEVNKTSHFESINPFYGTLQTILTESKALKTQLEEIIETAAAIKAIVDDS